MSLNTKDTTGLFGFQNRCSSCGVKSGLWISDTKDPPFSLIRSRYLPSEEESLHIQEAVNIAGSQIDALADELVRYQNIINQLEQKKKALELYQRGQSTLLSAFHRLPDEVLHGIFTTFFSSGSNVWKLGIICYRWRAVATSYYDLWTSINIRDLYSAERASFLLQRSHFYPLSIRFENFINTPTLDLLLAEKNRWQHISFPQRVSIFLFHGKNHTFSMLQSLDLVDPPISLLDIFKNAPNLTHLTLWDAEIVSEFPWHQLKSLKLFYHYRYPRALPVDILTKAHNLERLWVCGQVEARTTTVAHFPHLRILKVESEITSDGILAAINSPNLRDLSLASSDIERDIFWSIRTTFMSRVGYHLTTLTLRGMEEEPLLAILPFVPSLQELGILDLKGILRQIIQALHWTPHTPQGGILPLLRKLKIFHQSIDNKNNLAIALLVQSRNAAPTSCSPDCPRSIGPCFPVPFRQLTVGPRYVFKSFLQFASLEETGLDEHLEIYITETSLETDDPRY